MSSASFVVLSGFGLAASDFTTGTHMSSRPWIASASSQRISLRRDRLRPRRLPGLRDPPHQGYRQELVDSAILNSKGWQPYLLQPSRKVLLLVKILEISACGLQRGHVIKIHNHIQISRVYDCSLETQNSGTCIYSHYCSWLCSSNLMESSAKNLGLSRWFLRI
ncbi:unnamed protein product [Musa acuminata subsp. burmannicoides]